MQVLQWLFKVPQDHKQDIDHQHSNLEIKSPKVRETSKEVISYKKKRVYKKSQKPEETSLDCRKFRYLTLLLKKGNSRSNYFSSTLHQRRISNCSNYQKQHYIFSMKLKEEIVRAGLGKNLKADSSAHVGNKVLPINDSTSSSLSSLSSTCNADDQQHCRSSDQKKQRSNKGENYKAKTLSRMKELLRWAAAAKSDKGGKFGKKVLHFRNKSATVKSGGLDDDVSIESPKISLRWEVESHCSTTCSAASAPPTLKYDESCRRTGSWITTDDEFVVLEL